MGSIRISIAILVEPNPGPGIRSMIATDNDGNVIYSRAQPLGARVFTNNELAYKPLIAVLNWAKHNASEPVLILTDQEILVRQISGEWECRSERLQPLRAEAIALLQETGAQLRYIPARENMPARLLCRMAAHQARVDAKGGLSVA